MQTDTPTLAVPTVPGTPFEGGFYAGRLRVGTHVMALIVAPKAAETKGPWLPQYAAVPGADSFGDGVMNTATMAEAGSPIALWALGLDIGGFGDWYLPSRDELEILYRVFKPTAETNYTYRSGENPSALPPTHAYRDELPLQTSVQSFRAGQAEAFEDAWYWSSTQSSRYFAWLQGFDGGGQDLSGKSFEGRARAVRRLVID